MDRQGSPSELEAAYADVEQLALQRSSQQSHPRAILLGGQPGSGKSGLASMAVRDLGSCGGSVIIDADQLREKNPIYKSLSRADPQHAADHTHKEAAEWAKRLTKAAMQGRRNLVIDGTMRDPNGIQNLATQLREHGYTVEARVIAVNPEVSIMRARLRFEEQVASRGVGRFVNHAQHDAAYRGLAHSVSALELARAVDAIHVYDASLREIHSNKLVKGQWQSPSRAGHALTEEQTRRWTHAEHRSYVAVLMNIIDLAGKREERGAVRIGDGEFLESCLKRAQQHARDNLEDGVDGFTEAGGEEPLRRGASVESIRNRIIAARHARIHRMDAAGAATDERREVTPGLEAHDVSREAEAQRLVESAVSEKREQQAMVEASPLEKTWQESLAAYVQLKHDQVARLEDRLEKLLASTQKDLKRSAERKPGVFAFPRTRRAWQNNQTRLKSRVQSLVNRLGVVREIRSGMGVFAPRIEELATRKMRAAHPEMASDWDAMREAFRANQVKRRIVSREARQRFSAGQVNVQRAKLMIDGTK